MGWGGGWGGGGYRILAVGSRGLELWLLKVHKKTESPVCSVYQVERYAYHQNSSNNNDTHVLHRCITSWLLLRSVIHIDCTSTPLLDPWSTPASIHSSVQIAPRKIESRFHSPLYYPVFIGLRWHSTEDLLTMISSCRRRWNWAVLQTTDLVNTITNSSNWTWNTRPGLSSHATSRLS